MAATPEVRVPGQAVIEQPARVSRWLIELTGVEKTYRMGHGPRRGDHSNVLGRDPVGSREQAVPSGSMRRVASRRG